MSLARTAIAALVVALGTAFAAGQDKEPARVKEPPRADKLDIQIRYRIRADRDERVRQFRVLEKHLADLGFDNVRKNDPDRDLDILDPAAERFTGTIPSAKVFEVFKDPRVQTILFAPAGHMYPDSPDKPVAIRVGLREGLFPNAQQAFWLQTLDQLEQLGFREALGYDNRGYTQLRGTIPYKNLPRLLKDLRTEPAGWFLPDTPPDRLPRPFADRNPVRWVEVMAVADPPPPFAPEIVLPARYRLTPDLRAVLANPDLKETPLRVEVVYARPMADRLEDVRSRLVAAYGVSARKNPDGTTMKGPDGLPVLTDGARLDGAAGNVLSIRFDRPAAVERFATEPEVLSVRLPRQAVETATPLPPNITPATTAEVLRGSGVEALQKLGYTGTGVKVLVIGSDFSGYEKLRGTTLPKQTRLIDLTTELNPDILPLPADQNRVGAGLAAARGVALAAPAAELVLVRVDPASLFQLLDIIRLANGDTTYSDALRSRLTGLVTRSGEIARKKDAALADYRAAFQDQADDAPTKARRDRAKAALEAVIAEQDVLAKRVARFNDFQNDMTTALAGGRVVVNTLVWESGYALDALSELSQTLERLAAAPRPAVQRRPADPAAALKPPLMWVQAASGSGAAVWGGPFLDTNRDGTMEFAPPDAKLPPSNWSADMNFLGVRNATGEVTPDLPTGTRVRFTMQWREPLDPNFPSVDRPAYPVVLRVFRQIDPNGERLPSDEMAEDARSVAGPYPILLGKTFVVYEQILDFTVKESGRYALVVATGYQPDPQLPALRRDVEIAPRIFAETLGAKPGDGRVVFRSFVTPWAGVGIPGDSAGAITVGVPVPGELYGAGTGLPLRPKPDLFAPDAIDLGEPASRGSALAAGFIGGLAADLVQAGATGANPFQSSGFAPGRMAVVPENWLKYLKPVPRREK